MRIWLLLVLMMPLGAQVLLRQSAFAPGEWSTWSHRPETMPRTFIDAQVSRGGRGSLGINGASNVAAYGGWQKNVGGLEGGAWVRLRAFYKAESVTAEN